MSEENEALEEKRDERIQALEKNGWRRNPIFKRADNGRKQENTATDLFVKKTRVEDLKRSNNVDSNKQSALAASGESPFYDESNAESISNIGSQESGQNSSGKYFQERNSCDLPEVSSFTGYNTLKELRPNSPCMEIAYDSEWENLPSGKRLILSWQFAVIWDGMLYEFLFIARDSHELRLPFALGCILDVIHQDESSLKVKSIHPLDSRSCTEYEYCPEFLDGKPVVLTTKNWEVAYHGAKFIYRNQKFQNIRIMDMPDEERKAKRSKRDWAYFHRKITVSKDEKWLPITLLCHAGLGDVTALTPSYKHEGKEDSFLKCLTEVQGGVVSLEHGQFIQAFSVSDIDRHYFYPCLVTVRDTMCHAPADQKSLETLGRVVGYPKVDLPEGTKEHMQRLLDDDPVLFAQYASNDAVVTLLYASAIYGYNNAPPATLTSAAAVYAKNKISAYCHCKNDSDFLHDIRLLRSVDKGLIPKKDMPGFLKSTNLEPINSDALSILKYAANAYKGGYNICTEVGTFPFETFDYDLKSAYPTAMCLVTGINAKDPIAEEIKDKEMTWDTCREYWEGYDVLGPCRPFVGCVTFQFPDDVPYCCIAIPVEGSLVCPRSFEAESSDGVYISGPELYYALKCGAKVTCKRGYFLNPAYDGDKMLFPLAYVQKEIVEDRAKAKKNDGKGSLTELILKTISNSLYGKIAQDIDPKNKWDAEDDAMKDIGPSKITNPIWAASITSLVRVILIAAQNELEREGYSSYSVTTDGMITDAPIDVMNRLPLGGFAPYIQGARKYLTDGDPSVWEKKHTQNDLLNLTTRANISLSPEGVCAHGGIKSPYEKGSQEDRSWFIKSTLTRTGRIEFHVKEWTSLKDIIKHNEDFSVQDTTKNVRVDFDMKRKPIKKSLETEHPSYGGSSYEICHVKTEPFNNIEEYSAYKKTADGLGRPLRTKDDWEYFFARLDIRSSGSNARICKGTDFSVLSSCIMGFRAHFWEIGPLEKCKTTKEKLDYINRHNTSNRIYTENDWKNARRPERWDNILPRNLLEDKLYELQNDCSPQIKGVDQRQSGDDIS